MNTTISKRLDRIENDLLPKVNEYENYDLLIKIGSELLHNGFDPDERAFLVSKIDESIINISNNPEIIKEYLLNSKDEIVKVILPPFASEPLILTGMGIHLSDEILQKHNELLKLVSDAKQKNKE